MEQAKIERKDYISETDQKLHYTCRITFPLRLSEGDRWIQFKQPLWIECYYIQEPTETDPHRVAHFHFDFGMDGQTQLLAEHNFILMHDMEKSDEEKMIADITFDLFHAFFHVSCDPNYTYYHWALYGNLKDRVEIGEI